MKNPIKLSNHELNRYNIDTYKKIDKHPLIVVLDNVRSAINVGSIFRTSDAFMIEKIVLCGITACPPNKDILKTALGATESVDWSYENDTLTYLKSIENRNDYDFICVEQATNSIKLNDFKFHVGKKTILIFGNEVDGVSQAILDISDICLEIPQHGTKHSLNVAVSAGVVLWEISNKLNPKNS